MAGICSYSPGSRTWRACITGRTSPPYVEEEFGAQNLIVVWDAKGGMPICHWHRDWRSADGRAPAKTGQLYDRLMKKTQRAIDDEVIRSVIFIWMQGETDARNGQGDVYETSLLGLLDQVRSQLGRDDLNFVIGRISDFDMDNSEFPDWTMIREIQVRVAESDPRGSWIDTDDLNDGLRRRGKTIHNDLHYSKQGYELLGKCFARSAMDLVRKHGS